MAKARNGLLNERAIASNGDNDEIVMAGDAMRSDQRSSLINAPNILPFRPITSSYHYAWHDWMLGPLMGFSVFLSLML